MTFRFAAVMILTAAGAIRLSTGVAAGTESSQAMEKFFQRPPAAFSYRAHRRLEAAGNGQSAWLDAQTTFSRNTGLSYEVTAEGGSGYIRSRVLHALLEEERRSIGNGDLGSAEISRANYEFRSEGVDRDGLAQVALQPLRKERTLIDGRMFLKAADGTLLRIEGRLAKSPSFWITKVDIVRSYRVMNGALMPVALESRAQLRVMGAATLHMTYHYSDVNEQPVHEADARAQ